MTGWYLSVIPNNEYITFSIPQTFKLTSLFFFLIFFLFLINDTIKENFDLPLKIPSVFGHSKWSLNLYLTTSIKGNSFPREKKKKKRKGKEDGDLMWEQ